MDTSLRNASAIHELSTWRYIEGREHKFKALRAIFFSLSKQALCSAAKINSQLKRRLI